jgi:hypothetical protein
MKRNISCMLAFFLSILIWIPPVIAETDSIVVYLNKEKIIFDERPIIQNDITLVQFRPLLEKLGMSVSWYSENLKIEAKNNEKTIQLQIGNEVSYINGKQLKLEAPPAIINGYAFVPLRFVSEATDATVNWDAATQTIMITPKMAAPGNEERVAQPVKQKRDSYSVDTIAVIGSSSIEAGATFSSLIVDNKNNAYLFQDRNLRLGGNPANLIDIEKINLTTGQLNLYASIDQSYDYEYNDLFGKKSTSKYYDFTPQMLAYDIKRDKLILGGLSNNYNGYLLSFHERLPKMELLAYRKTNGSSTTVKNFMKYVDDESILFSDLSNREIYVLNRGKEPELIAKFAEDSGVKITNNTIDAVLTKEAVYLFDSFNSTLFKVDRNSGRTSKIYQKEGVIVNSVTTNKGKFYILAAGGIFELDTMGNWSTFIEEKQLVYNKPFPNAPANVHSSLNGVIAFDADDNLIFVSGGNPNVIGRINR